MLAGKAVLFIIKDNRKDGLVIAQGFVPFENGKFVINNTFQIKYPKNVVADNDFDKTILSELLSGIVLNNKSTAERYK
jgi:hypothetical protein